MNDKAIIGGIVAIILIVGGGLFYMSGSGVTAPGSASAPDGAVELAQCLTEKGAIFYGAFWCPHCQTQKRLFGSAEKLLPYVECSTPDGNAQLPVCIEKEIKSYPTWVFADGKIVTGEQSFDQLRALSGCVLGSGAGTEAAPASVTTTEANAEVLSEIESIPQ